jgi:hypothetical protein
MAATREKGESSGSVETAAPEPSLEDLLKSLNLKGEDIEGFFVAKDEVQSLKEGTKWMAVVRLLSSKPFSVTSLKKTMRFAWAPAQEVRFRDLEENKFIVQASCLGDWQRITEQGPWIFRDYGLLVEKYDGSCKASSVELNRIHAWVQIHDVPELFRKKPIIAGLAGNIGEVILVDMNSSREDGGNYVRARLWLDVRKSLTRFVSIKPEGEAPVIMRVKYEKVPRYCSVCGLIGHVKEECGTGEHLPSEVVFGKWMLADTAWNRAQLHGDSESQRQFNRAPNRDTQASGGRDAGFGGGGRGASGRGRGSDGGRGRGMAPPVDNRKRSSTEASLTECSPVKGGQPPLLLTWKEPGVIEASSSASAQQKLDFDGEKELYPLRSGTPPPPPSAREQKRSRKSNTPKKSKIVVDMAGSGKEYRPVQ